MKSILLYIKERFPIPSALLFSLGFAAFTLGLSSNSNAGIRNYQDSLINLVLLSNVFLFFLLRQRTIDEFRDADHDLKYFPDRPVPRGLISKKQVLLLGLFAFVLEITSAYFVGHKHFGFYILFFLYSLLMAKEFFIPKWLNKHFTTYFLIHEVIFLLLGLFFLIALNPDDVRFNLHTLILLTVLTTAPMSIEIIRKFSPRYDTLGKAVADTYSTVWGRSNSLLILISSSLVVGIGLFILKNSYIFILFNIMTVIAWLTFGKKSDTAVILIGAINFLGFALLANII